MGEGGFVVPTFEYLHCNSRVENREKVDQVAFNLTEETRGGVISIIEKERQEARNEAVEETTTRFAKGLLAKKMPFEDIIDLTGLSLERLNELRK